MLVRVKDSNRHVQFLRNDSYRFCKVGIVRDEHRDLELLAESVSNEM
jgi:hypothetical protein